MRRVLLAQLCAERFLADESHFVARGAQCSAALAVTRLRGSSDDVRLSAQRSKLVQRLRATDVTRGETQRGRVSTAHAIIMLRRNDSAEPLHKQEERKAELRHGKS